MIHTLKGTLQSTTETFAVVDVHGVGFKVALGQRSFGHLPLPGGEVFFFTHLHVKEDALDLYGFENAEELRFFELLISVSGVGPKSALAILSIADLKTLAAAIKEGRPDLLTRVSGIGRKTAERVIVELKTKVESDKSGQTVKEMESDSDVIDMLVHLGYRREQAKQIVGKIPEAVVGVEARLKEALKVLSTK